MTAWVSGIVRVMWQSTCGVVIAVVRVENGSGGSSPGCRSRPAQSIVLPSSRGGVPVFSRPSRKPARSSVGASPTEGASPTRPAGIFTSPMWIRPRRNVPVVITTAPASKLPTVAQHDATRPGPRRAQGRRPRPRRSVRSVLGPQHVLHRRPVELPVRLRPRTPDRRTLAPVEHPELDAGPVRGQTHDPVERVDLPDQMSLAETADRGVARHGADRRERLRHQGGRCTHPRRGRSRLGAGVAAAHHDHVETAV